MPNPFADATLKQIALRQTAAVSEPAPDVRTGMGPLGLIGLEAGQGLDLGTTIGMTQSDRFHETNALGAPAVLAFKAAMMAGLPILAKKLKMTRKQSDLLGVLAGITGAIPGAMNLRTLATTPRKK